MFRTASDDPARPAAAPRRPASAASLHPAWRGGVKHPLQSACWLSAQRFRCSRTAGLPSLQLFHFRCAGMAVQLAALLRGSGRTVHFLRSLRRHSTVTFPLSVTSLLGAKKQNRPPPGLHVSARPHLSLVVFLLEFGPLSTGLLQQRAELPQSLVPVGERGEGLLLQLLCLSHPVHTLQPETHTLRPT